MKKTFRFLSMAALALMGAVMTGCTNDDNIDNPKIVGEGNVVTQTITVSLDGKAATRALTDVGVKTFDKDDLIAVVYTNTSDETVKAVSTALAATDITDEGKTATFTVTLTDPKASTEVTYIYPAAMAKDDGSVNYAALATQDGTLASLAADLDLAIGTGTLSVTGALPTTSVALANPLAILALTLKDNGDNDITSSITGLTVSDGTNTYSVTRAGAAGPIYVAIQPTTSADISVTATDGTQSYHNYGKFLTGKTYEASNGYSVSWKMLPRVDLSAKSGSYNVTRNEILTGTPSGTLTIGCSADYWEVTLDNVNPDGAKDVRIKSNKHVTVKLKGTSKLTQIATTASGKNLTIDKAAADGTVILKMNSGSETPLDAYGTITINGGTVKAKQEGNFYVVYPNVVINGGAVYLARQNLGQIIPLSNNISGSVTIYSWNGSWNNFNKTCQYASTDNSSGNNPSSWTW